MENTPSKSISEAATAEKAPRYESDSENSSFDSEVSSSPASNKSENNPEESKKKYKKHKKKGSVGSGQRLYIERLMMEIMEMQEEIRLKKRQVKSRLRIVKRIVGDPKKVEKLMWDQNPEQEQAIPMGMDTGEPISMEMD